MAGVERVTGWQDEVLAKIDSGVNGTQLDRQLRLTPTERMEEMLRFLQFLEDAKRSHGDRPA
jgi:hypothetical protein